MPRVLRSDNSANSVSTSRAARLAVGSSRMSMLASFSKAAAIATIVRIAIGSDAIGA